LLIREPEIVMDFETLFREVQEKHRRFLRSLFWSDACEVVGSLLVAAVFYYAGTRRFGGWPLFAAAALMICLALCYVVNRAIQRRKARAFGNSAKGAIERALHQVNHRIWLCESVSWWYLLLCIVAGTLPVAHGIAFVSSRGPVPYWLTLTAVMVGIGASVMVIWFGSWLNRRAVRNDLAPRREELMAVARELS
jgi:FtsH-binding integral membrane protein